jgi:hypothetical protein
MVTCSSLLVTVVGHLTYDNFRPEAVIDELFQDSICIPMLPLAFLLALLVVSFSREASVLVEAPPNSILVPINIGAFRG